MLQGSDNKVNAETGTLSSQFVNVLFKSPAFHIGSFSQAVSRCRLEQVQSSAPSMPWNYSPARLPVSTAAYISWDAAKQLEGSVWNETSRPPLPRPWISAVSVPAGTASIMSTPAPLCCHPPTPYKGEAGMDQLTQDKRKIERKKKDYIAAEHYKHAQLSLCATTSLFLSCQ